ncbi:MAG: SusD/RagB family nutrient-binding outer membrane lipoprotein [Chitinophagaceae bacterium]
MYTIFKRLKATSTALSIVIIAASLAGCTKNFTATNTDATKIATVGTAEYPYMFANALTSASPAINDYEIGEAALSLMYSQLGTQAAQSFTTDRYVIPQSWLPSSWNPFYTAVAPQLRTIIQNTDPASPENAVANIWWVWTFHRVTDDFGPIPYSQAANGQRYVKYDSQDSIYYDFFKRLDASVAVLKASAGKKPFTTFDLIYRAKTDPASAWLKFANTLRLRLAMRISKVDPTRAKTEAEKAVADGVMTAVADDAMLLKSTTIYQEYNPLSQITAWEDIRMSSTIESMQRGYNDPRMTIYFQPAYATGQYHGFRNGLIVAEKVLQTNSRPYTSNFGTRWATQTNNAWTAKYAVSMDVMHAAEAYFLRAEGALNGWNMGGSSAQQLYETGIAMSMAQWGVTDQTAIANYTSNPATPVPPGDGLNSPAVNDYPVLWSSDPTMQRKQVAQQKWLALFPDGREAWAEVRRTTYPKLYPLVHSDNPDLPVGKLIRRLPYLNDEKQTNTDAVNAAIKLLNGPDNSATPLWWDKN